VHCYTLTETGVHIGIKVSRSIVEGKERAGIMAGDNFILFEDGYSDRLLAWMNKYKPKEEIVTNIDFDANDIIIPSSSEENSSYAVALVDVKPMSPGGRNEITAEVKQERRDDSGLVRRTFRNVGDAVGIRVYFPVTDSPLNISEVMEIAAGGALHKLKSEEEIKAREECLGMLARWTEPLILIMTPGSAFRVYRRVPEGTKEEGPKIFTFSWVWYPSMRSPAMRWKVHHPRQFS
jgi:hypothetical protein